MFAKGERDLVEFRAKISREREEGKCEEWESHLGEAGKLSSARLHRVALILQSPLALKAQKPAVSQHKEIVHLSGPISSQGSSQSNVCNQDSSYFRRRIETAFETYVRMTCLFMSKGFWVIDPSILSHSLPGPIAPPLCLCCQW